MINKHKAWLNQAEWKIQDAVKEAITTIKEHLSESGNIHNIDMGNLLFGLYLDEDDYGVAATYAKVEIYCTGELLVTLSDGHTIYEADLTANTVIHVLTIIKEQYGTYSQPL